MSLLYAALVLIVIGFLCWLVDKKIPMNDIIKNILFGAVIIWIIWWLGYLFGICPPPPLNINLK